jgi:hypothetical protein
MLKPGHSKASKYNDLSFTSEQIICLLKKFSKIFRSPVSVVPPKRVRHFNKQIPIMKMDERKTLSEKQEQKNEETERKDTKTIGYIAIICPLHPDVTDTSVKPSTEPVSRVSIKL